MSDLDLMSDAELALYVSRTQTALEFAEEAEDRARLEESLAALQREQGWREQVRGTPRVVVRREFSRIVTDIVSTALQAA